MCAGGRGTVRVSPRSCIAWYQNTVIYENFMHHGTVCNAFHFPLSQSNSISRKSTFFSQHILNIYLFCWNHVNDLTLYRVDIVYLQGEGLLSSLHCPILVVHCVQVVLRLGQLSVIRLVHCKNDNGWHLIRFYIVIYICLLCSLEHFYHLLKWDCFLRFPLLLLRGSWGSCIWWRKKSKRKKTTRTMCP